ncbi:MAG: hypothetical protein V1837_05355 [Candidatus Woesearchaeota archaeon]
MQFKETKVGKLIPKAVNWIHDRWVLLLLSMVMVLAYSIIHEYIHYFANLALGHTGYITYGLMAYFFHFNDLGTMPVVHYFLIGSAPYFFDMTLLLIVFCIYNIRPRYKTILAKIAFFPALDIVWNCFMILPSFITQSSDDFLNMLRIAALHNRETVAIMIGFITLVLLLGIFLFTPFWPAIKDLLWVSKKELVKS